MAAGKIELNFDKLLANYSDFKHLPDYIKNYLDPINAPIIKRNIEHQKLGEDLEHLNTSCCLQVSNALNLTETDPAKKIGPKSLAAWNKFRANVELPKGSGRYCVGNVLELEEHLKAAYGPGEEVKTATANTREAIEGNVKPRTGILLFRDGGSGFHTELFNKTSIVQNGAPSTDGSARGLMSSEIFNQKRVVFWETVGSAVVAAGTGAPDWLEGWWEIKDKAATYYYYFYPFGTVYFTQTRPAPMFCPITTSVNSGTYTIDAQRRITINWNVGPEAREFYTPTEASNPSTLAGALPNGGPPFSATKFK